MSHEAVRAQVRRPPRVPSTRRSRSIARSRRAQRPPQPTRRTWRARLSTRASTAPQPVAILGSHHEREACNSGRDTRCQYESNAWARGEFEPLQAVGAPVDDWLTCCPPADPSGSRTQPPLLVAEAGHRSWATITGCHANSTPCASPRSVRPGAATNDTAAASTAASNAAASLRSSRAVRASKAAVRTGVAPVPMSNSGSWPWRRTTVVRCDSSVAKDAPTSLTARSRVSATASRRRSPAAFQQQPLSAVSYAFWRNAVRLTL